MQRLVVRVLAECYHRLTKVRKDHQESNELSENRKANGLDVWTIKSRKFLEIMKMFQSMHKYRRDNG